LDKKHDPFDKTNLREVLLINNIKMKTENKELMRQARETLTGKWGMVVKVSALYIVIAIALQSVPKAGPLISLLTTGSFSLGLVLFFLAFSRNQNPKLELMFEGFKRYSTSLAAYLLVTLFTVLWGLLLIVPGIIASLSYSMTFFILADNKDIGAKEAIERSKIMMYGYKWKYFCLLLRFLGWALLCIPTLGIGFIWLLPYIQVTCVKFYEDIKNSSSEPVSI